MTDDNDSTLKSLCMTYGDYRTRFDMGKQTFTIVQDGDAWNQDIVLLTRDQAVTIARAILKAVGESQE